MFGGFGVTELVIILVIVVLVFGTKKLKGMGGDLGGAIKGFRKAVGAEEEPEPKNPGDEPQVIEGEASNSSSSSKQESKQQRNV